MKKSKKCRHNNCKRMACPEDNDMGYCDRCIQLPTKECNCCLLKEDAPDNKLRDVVKEFESIRETRQKIRAAIFGALFCIIILLLYYILNKK